MANAGIQVRRLSNEQKKQVFDLWGKDVDLNLHELIYSATGLFRPEYCPLVHFRTKIEYAMNDQRLAHAWSDKNYYDKFFPFVEFPESIVRNVNGIFLNHEYEPITVEKAIELTRKESSVIIKPSLDSFCGAGVAKFHNTDNIVKVFQEYGRNFVVQKVLSQYALLSAFNPTSVNVIRYNSLYWNGKVHPLSATLRCGANGAVNDNSITADGRGMFVIGVEKDGRLKDTAFYACGEKLNKSPNGVEFKDTIIPNFEKVTEIVKKIHEQMPQFGFIGFDIAFKEDGSPIVMEYNILVPGIMYYQYTNGPLFGDFTTFIANKYKK